MVESEKIFNQIGIDPLKAEEEKTVLEEVVDTEAYKELELMRAQDKITAEEFKDAVRQLCEQLKQQ